MISPGKIARVNLSKQTVTLTESEEYYNCRGWHEHSGLQNEHYLRGKGFNDVADFLKKHGYG